MERMTRSAERVALPVRTVFISFLVSSDMYFQAFDADALLVLIKRLVEIESRWIPRARGCSLYIRPTLIGTRPSLRVSASTHAALYVILSPTGPYIHDPNDKGFSLLAMNDQLRPGGTGEFKLGLNYAAGFPAQRVAAALGYQQLLWILGETVAEAGAMNVFAVFERLDGGKSPSLIPGWCDLRSSDLLIHRVRRTRRGHTPTRRHDPAWRDTRLGAGPTLPPSSHSRAPAVAARRADPHHRTRVDDVGAFCSVGGGHASGDILCWHCGRRHTCHSHRVAACTPRRERGSGNGVGGHRAASSWRVGKPRADYLAAPCGYPGGARRMGGMGALVCL